MFGKFTSKFTVSKGGTPTASLTHISSQTSGARCWLLVIGQIGVVFLCTRHSWLHGYVQSHPVHICVIGITTIICKKDCIIQNKKIVSLFEGWMFIIRYIHDFQQRIKIFFPSAAMERRKARSFPRPWLPPRPPQDSSPSASTTQPPWRGWA